MSAQQPRCPLCGAPSARALTARDRNRETTPERFTYNRCSACASLFLVDVPDELAPYYANGYHGFGADGEPEWTTNPTLQEVEAFRVALLRRHVDPGPLIDIGAGAGAFASAARREGFDVTAIEMDARCCEYIARAIGARAICTQDPVTGLRALGPARVISLWHVLEHLRDPDEMLATVAERLQPGGVLALGVPNPRSLQFAFLKARWAHLDAPRHLCLAPAEALAARLHGYGLRPIDATSGDPFGAICSLHGWTYALRVNPARRESPTAVIRTARLITRALRPLEARRRYGAALTLLFAREP